jgi:hypothetical protein
MNVKVAALVAILSFTSPVRAKHYEWKDSTLIKTETINAWCRHCPDANQTLYSFKLGDGTVYVARTHKTLDITLNGHTQFRVEKDGHVGDYVHVLDDAGKDMKLRIVQRIAPKEGKPQNSGSVATQGRPASFLRLLPPNSLTARPHIVEPHQINLLAPAVLSHL